MKFLVFTFVAMACMASARADFPPGALEDCEDLEPGWYLYECAFKLHKKTEAEFNRAYKKVLSRTYEEKKLIRAQKQWERLVEFECREPADNRSAYAAAAYQLCHVRKMKIRAAELPDIYIF